MCNTNSSLHGYICTSLMAALLQLPLSAIGDTHSSLSAFIVTSPFFLHLCAMGNTNSSLLGLIGTSLKAASFYLCTMRDTDSSLPGIVGAVLVIACLSSLYTCLTPSLDFLTTGFFFFLQSLYRFTQRMYHFNLRMNNWDWGIFSIVVNNFLTMTVSTAGQQWDQGVDYWWWQYEPHMGLSSVTYLHRYLDCKWLTLVCYSTWLCETLP